MVSADLPASGAEVFSAGDSLPLSGHSLHSKSIPAFRICFDGHPQIGLLTTVINNTPIVPEDSSEDVGLMLSDNRQCIMFALFMIWFASITVNLGTTFLSGGLAANADDILLEPSCPIILGPYRHYALNFLWILTIVFCLTLTLYHLRKLRR